jgi:hypothetical protein
VILKRLKSLSATICGSNSYQFFGFGFGQPTQWRSMDD